MQKKQLFRSKDDRVFAGVCGGISEYLKLESFIIRILTIIIILVSGWGIILYIMLWLAIPKSPKQTIIKKTSLTELADSLEERIKNIFDK